MTKTLAGIEPILIDGDIPPQLAELTIKIAGASARLARLGEMLPHDVRENLVHSIRLANASYSNLLVGWPISAAEAQARIYFEVEQTLDISMGMIPPHFQQSPARAEFVRFLHQTFYEQMPAKLRNLKPTSNDPSSSYRTSIIVPGHFRGQPPHPYVHGPTSFDQIAAFLLHYEERLAEAGPAQRILQIPAAHHRLLLIRPFDHGNGRVSQLLTHEMARYAGIAAGRLWSLNRGLARGLKSADEYPRMIALAGAPRRGDDDGPGPLSRRALIDFSEWFLAVIVDQIAFSASIFDLDTLAARYRDLCRRIFGTKHQGKFVSTLLRVGSVPRKGLPAITGLSASSTDAMLNQLFQHGFILQSHGSAQIRIDFPIEIHADLFPGLFPDDLRTGAMVGSHLHT